MKKPRSAHQLGAASDRAARRWQICAVNSVSVKRASTSGRRNAPAALTALRQLRDEHTCLQRAVADLTLDKHLLSDHVNKALMPAKRLTLVGWIKERYQKSTLTGRHLAQFSRSEYRRKSHSLKISRPCGSGSARSPMCDLALASNGSASGSDGRLTYGQEADMLTVSACSSGYAPLRGGTLERGFHA